MLHYVCEQIRDKRKPIIRENGHCHYQLQKNSDNNIIPRGLSDPTQIEKEQGLAETTPLTQRLRW